MPNIIYYSRPITWYPQWHVSRVHKRVLKLVNFEVQKVQKPEFFNFKLNWSLSRDDIGLTCHIPHLCGIFLTNAFGLGSCGPFCFQTLTGHYSHERSDLILQLQPGMSGQSSSCTRSTFSENISYEYNNYIAMKHNKEEQRSPKISCTLASL